MKLELIEDILSLLEAGGKWEDFYYAVRNSAKELHREDGPAVIHTDGTRYWCRNGAFHRSDGPAVIHPDGRQEWHGRP
jgi:hypothetical protein